MKEFNLTYNKKYKIKVCQDTVFQLSEQQSSKCLNILGWQWRGKKATVGGERVYLCNLCGGQFGNICQIYKFPYSLTQYFYEYLYMDKMTCTVLFVEAKDF